MSFPLTLEHRRKLLEDAPAYFVAAERVLRCCAYVDKTSHIPQPLYQADFGLWNGEVIFLQGYVLKFRESYRRHDSGLIERIINYDFRVQHSEEVTFRVDAHGQPVWIDGQLHLDLPKKVVYEEGDPKLNGYSLLNFTLIDMVHLIQLKLEGETLPWG